MRISPTEKCTTCRETDFIEHFFFDCKIVSKLWKEVEREIQRLFSVKIQLSAERVFLGIISHKYVQKKDLEKINHILLITKMTISKYKYGNHPNLFNLFQQDMYLRGYH